MRTKSKVYVSMRDTETGTVTVLVDGADGIVAAGQQLGISHSQMSKLIRGQCKWGLRNNPRFVYEFRTEKKAPMYPNGHSTEAQIPN